MDCGVTHLIVAAYEKICQKTRVNFLCMLMFFSGHMLDPDELPGLAHFCEHMLFLGTKKVFHL